MPTSRALILVSLCLAAFAFAGSRVKESAALAPTAATDGISLLEVTACRAVVYEDGGTINTGGKILLSYYEPAFGWVEADTASQCTVTAVKADGGTRAGYACPEFAVNNRFGRVAAQTYGVVWSDGGTGKTRLECFTPATP